MMEIGLYKLHAHYWGYILLLCNIRVIYENPSKMSLNKLNGRNIPYVFV